MKRSSRKCLFPAGIWMISLMMLCASALSLAQEAEPADRTLSPYFFVKSEDPEVDCLPLKETSAEVHIAGVIADVRVTQVYENTGHKPLEAVYIFPASTRAAVYGLKMSIGERTIVAEVRERKQARLDYETAREAGQSASLLEQQRPNVFQMNVANILPGDRIQVELQYTELLIPTNGIYEFVYPTVVGPRYSNQDAGSAPPSEHWVENPYLHQGETAPYTFDMDVHLSAGMPIKDLSCVTHRVQTNFKNPGQAAIRLDTSETFGGNRDFILKYRLAGGKIASGLLLYEGDDEDFFLLMVQPPGRVAIRQIPPREYIFIVDVSGSMHGFPLDISKQLLKDLIGNLRPTDTFNVLLFAGCSSLLSEKSLPATEENIQKAITVIERQQGGGGTELLPALQRALALPHTEGGSRTVVIATDGYVTVEAEAFDLIRNRLGEANMFAFGIGSSVNRHLIEGMARVGMGEPFIVTRQEEAPARAAEFRKLIASPVLTGIEADFGDFEVYDIEPPSIPDVLAERPVIIFGKWQGHARGTITVEGITGEGRYVKKFDVRKYRPGPANAALKYLWARHRIAILGDYNVLHPDDERVKEITNLGLSSNLLTAYTSFVAIDSFVRVTDGKTVLVKQPLPLPQGVSDYALGGSCKKIGYAPTVATSAGSFHAPEEESSDILFRDKEEGAEIDGDRDMSLRLEKISARGAVSLREIERTLEKNLDAMASCFGEAGAGLSAKSGEMILELQLNASGQLTRVDLVSFKYNKIVTQTDRLGKCIETQLSGLQFPATSDGKSAIVTVQIIIR